MSKKAVKTEVIQYEEILKRLKSLLTEIVDIAKELETNDLALVARLLILDSIRIKKAAHFKGVEVRRHKN